MPSFTKAEHMRCFSVFEIERQDSENPSNIVVILDMSGTQTWYSVTKKRMREMADRLETAVKMLQISDTKDVAAARQKIFAQDASRRSDKNSADNPPLGLVENWRIGWVGDATVLELLIRDRWPRYLMDIVCASNLIVQFRDALHANFQSGSGTVH